MKNIDVYNINYLEAVDSKETNGIMVYYKPPSDKYLMALVGIVYKNHKTSYEALEEWLYSEYDKNSIFYLYERQ